MFKVSILLATLLLAPGQNGRPLLQAITASCPDADHQIAPARSLPEDFIQLERTSCFGPCPVYTVRILADGRVQWNGAGNVRVSGKEVAQIDPVVATALIEKARTAGFWSLCGSYTISVSDVPDVITTLHLGDQERRVLDRFNMAPAWLRALETEVDATAETARWIHGALVRDDRSRR